MPPLPAHGPPPRPCLEAAPLRRREDPGAPTFAERRGVREPTGLPSGLSSTQRGEGGARRHVPATELLMLFGENKHLALPNAWLHLWRQGQAGDQGSKSNRSPARPSARGRPGARGGVGYGVGPGCSARPRGGASRGAAAGRADTPLAAGCALRPRPRAPCSGSRRRPGREQGRAGPGRAGPRPGPRRSWVLSARAAGGLSVRERPGPIQWPLSAGPFVQEAATSCGAWLGRAGGNAPSRAEARTPEAPAWGQRPRPPPWSALGLGPAPRAEQGAKLGPAQPSSGSQCAVRRVGGSTGIRPGEGDTVVGPPELGEDRKEEEGPQAEESSSRPVLCPDPPCACQDSLKFPGLGTQLPRTAPRGEEQPLGPAGWESTVAWGGGRKGGGPQALPHPARPPVPPTTTGHLLGAFTKPPVPPPLRSKTWPSPGPMGRSRQCSAAGPPHGSPRLGVGWGGPGGLQRAHKPVLQPVEAQTSLCSSGVAFPKPAHSRA